MGKLISLKNKVCHQIPQKTIGSRQNLLFRHESTHLTFSYIWIFPLKANFSVLSYWKTVF
jgi:hypothetical protein